MAFGYALLKGRSGAEGYVRESGGSREVYAHGLPGGTHCALYAVQENDIIPCGASAADGEGSAHWVTAVPGRVFIADGQKVLLWDGGDGAFLRASEWLSSQGRARAQSREENAAPEISSPQIQPEQTERQEIPPEAFTQAAEQLPAYPFENETRADSAQAAPKERPPERASWALRPAGTGEPVDTLPERR